MSTYDQDYKTVELRLREVGITCQDPYQLLNEPTVLDEAAPVLLELLAEVSATAVKADLIRVASSAQISPRPFLDELAKLRPKIAEGDLEATHLAWTICETMEQLVDQSTFDTIVNHLRDRSLGRARQMLPLALAKVKARRKEATQILLESIDDEDITPHTLAALGQLKATEVLPAIQRHLDSPNQLVRTEAKKALKKIEKAMGKAKPKEIQFAPPLAREQLAKLEEASTNFDQEDVAPFLRQVARLVDGFGTKEITWLDEHLLEMELDAEEAFDFHVRYNGETVPLRIEVFMDDEGTPDIAFFSVPELAAAIDAKIEAWLEREQDE